MGSRVGQAEALRADRVINGGTNCWVYGSDTECVVIDAAHDAEAIIDLTDGRRVVAVVCTHAHPNHINVAPLVADALDAPILVHSSDVASWDEEHPERPTDGVLGDGQRIPVAGRFLKVLHTPGHSPGGVAFYDESAGVIFTGDTLVAGGPGNVSHPRSSYPTITDSIRDRLLPLPDATVVHPGHGEDTTIGVEADRTNDWLHVEL